MNVNDFGPFDPDIWGHVSEWLMVIVTGLTAFYLYNTLKSQLEVQRIQNELFKIESLKLKESVKPLFKYSGSTDEIKPGDEGKKILTIELTNESGSAALNISKIVSENGENNQIFIPRGYSNVRNYLSKGDIPLQYYFIIDEKKTSGFVTFALEYQDVAGTKYKQRVFCICDDYGLEIHPSLPEMIT